MSQTKAFAYRTMQAANSNTFHIPPAFLERTMPVTDLWDHHYQHSSNHPLFVYADDSVKEGEDVETRTLTWGDSVKAMYRVGNRINEFVYPEKRGVVVGILAVKDTATFWTLITGCIRAGQIPFLISSRNSAIAVAHLLKATNCHYLLVSNDSGTKSVVDAALELLKNEEKAFEVKVGHVPDFQDVFGSNGDEDVVLSKLEDVNLDERALIAHSSGSTSFPKPRTLTHKNLIQWALQAFYAEVDWCGVVFGVHALPMFRKFFLFDASFYDFLIAAVYTDVMGFLSVLLRPTGSGSINAVFPPVSPPRVPSPESVLEGIKRIKCNVVFIVPSFLQSWGLAMDYDPEIGDVLRTLDCLQFAGGPLQKDAGDKLINGGVKVSVVFGATEYGSINRQTLECFEDDWEYMKIATDDAVIMESQGEGSGLYEMLLKDSDFVTPCVLDRTVDGVRVYSTSDLFVKHPTVEGMWRIHGRSDDQIMHSTGEKTNPGPLEAIISGHPFVRAAIMFGRAQFQAGILIDPAEGKQIDPDDSHQLAKFRNEIWEFVEKANAFAPKHSRIYKEMIVVSNARKPFEYTAKGTPRRQVIVNTYEDEIKAAYAAAEESSVQGVDAPTHWDDESATEFVRNVVNKLLPHHIGDEDDLFQMGADSLHATSIRNAILRAFRTTNVDTTHLSQNLVYSHPTIASLGKFISQIAAGDSEGASATSVTAKMTEMNGYVEEFTKKFASHSGSVKPDGEVLLITGTTGSLGSLILGQILALPSVNKVYAFNRPSRGGSITLKERQAKVFAEQGLDVELLDSDKLVLVEGDTSARDLGIDKALYNDILSSVTTIVHNAWRVDFNIGLSSFRPLVQGVRNLVDFALASTLNEPPRIIFTSSIAGTANWGKPEPVPEKINSDPVYALGNGYGESKWVSERILQITREKTPVKTMVVRVGQLAGSRINGNWNTAEWFPAIVQSYKPLGCLPDGSGVVSWVPIDIAASVIVELRDAPVPVVNLVNPKPVSWSSLIKHFASSLGVPLVPYAEWYKRLEKAVNDAFSSGNGQIISENPAFKLAEFYGGMKDLGNDELEAFISNRFETKEVVRLTKSLGENDSIQLGEEDVQRWIAYWRTSGAVKN